MKDRSQKIAKYARYMLIILVCFISTFLVLKLCNQFSGHYGYHISQSIESAKPIKSKERPSPKDRLGLNNLHLEDNGIKIKVNSYKIVKIADTNSMDPVIDEGSEVIEITPKTYDELKVGDIISYESYKYGVVIIHRIIKIGKDRYGWYAICKGDNNKVEDAEKVRFNQIRGVVVAILY